MSRLAFTPRRVPSRLSRRTASRVVLTNHIARQCVSLLLSRVWVGIGAVTPECLMKPYRLAMFDLDGTLAASKSGVSPSTARMLCALLAAIDVCIISGGRVEQFDAQVLRHFGNSCDLERLHLMPTCGTRYLRWQEDAGAEMYFERLSSEERNCVIDVLGDAPRSSASRQLKLGVPHSRIAAARSRILRLASALAPT